jgi:hypothetical protein
MHGRGTAFVFGGWDGSKFLDTCERLDLLNTSTTKQASSTRRYCCCLDLLNTNTHTYIDKTTAIPSCSRRAPQEGIAVGLSMYVYIYVYVCMYMCVCMLYVCMICMYVCMFDPYVCMFLYVRMFVCMCVCMYVCIHFGG